MKTKNQSTSMAPLILPDDKIIITKVSVFKTNDIVVFAKGKRLVAHRLIYIDPLKNFFITKGDNNLKSDRKIKPGQILGKVKTIKRDKEIINLSHFYLSQSSVYLKELIKISKALDQKHIPYIILKGLPLHLHFGRTPPKRLYLDADILIKKSYLTKTHKLLIKLGFEKQQDSLFGKKIKEAIQLCYVKPTKPFPVIFDLHLEPAIGFTKIKSPNKLLPRKKGFEKYLFENIKSVKINTNKFPILATEALLVYLLLHLYHHNFQGAHRMKFIDNLIRNQKVEWKRVINTMQKFKLENFVFPGILVLERYYQTPFPKNFIKVIPPPITQRFISRTVARFVSPFSSGTRTQEGVKRFILILLLSPSSASQKIKVFLEKETRNYFLSTIKSFFLRSSKN